jgi:hypothetical protein
MGSNGTTKLISKLTKIEIVNIISEQVLKLLWQLYATKSSSEQACKHDDSIKLQKLFLPQALLRMHHHHEIDEIVIRNLKFYFHHTIGLRISIHGIMLNKDFSSIRLLTQF